MLLSILRGLRDVLRRWSRTSSQPFPHVSVCAARFLMITLAGLVAAGGALPPTGHHDLGSGRAVISEAGLEMNGAAVRNHHASAYSRFHGIGDVSAAAGALSQDEDETPDELLQRVTSPVQYGVARPLPPATAHGHLGRYYEILYTLSMPLSPVTMTGSANGEEYDALVCLDIPNFQQNDIELRTLDISGTEEQTWPTDEQPWNTEGQTWRTNGFVNFTGMHPICMADANLNFFPALTVSPSRRDVFIFGFGVYDECAELFVWSNVAGLRHVATSGGDQVAHLYHSLTSQAIAGDAGVRLVAFGGILCPHVDETEINECHASNNVTNSLWQLDMRSTSAILPAWQPVGIAAGSAEPSPRFSADIFAVNSSALVMYGGFRFRHAGEPEPLCDLWLFDGATPGRWTQLGNLSEDCRLRSGCRPGFNIVVRQLATFVTSSSTMVVVSALCQSRGYTVYSFDVNSDQGGEWRAAERSPLISDPAFYFFSGNFADDMKLVLVSSANGSLYLVDSTGASMHRLVFHGSHISETSSSPPDITNRSRAALLSMYGSDRFIGTWGCVAGPPITLPVSFASPPYVAARHQRTHTFLLGGICDDGHNDLPLQENTVMSMWTIESIGSSQPESDVYYTKTVPRFGPPFGQRIGHSAVYQSDAGAEMIAMFGGGVAQSIDSMQFKGALADLWCFDIHNYIWVSSTTEGSGPPPRMFHVAFSITNTSFAVYGGSEQRGGGSNSIKPTNDLWLFIFTDVASCTGNWANLTAVAEPPLPSLFGHTTILFGGYQLIYGGGNDTDYGIVSDLLFSIDVSVSGSVSWHNLSFGPSRPPPGRVFHSMSKYSENSLLIMGNRMPVGQDGIFTTTMLFVFNTSDILSPAAVTAVPFFDSHVTYFMQKVGGYLLGGHTTFQNSYQVDGRPACSYGKQYAMLQFGLCPLGREPTRSLSLMMLDCEPCAKSTYSSTLNQQCTACINGTVTSSVGAENVSACFAPDQCLPDPCHGHGSCRVESGRAVCYCDPGYIPQTQCYLPVLFIIAGVVGLVAIATVTAGARKYRRSRRQAYERGRQLRASHRKISELTRVWEIEWQQLSMREKVAAGGFGEVWLAEFSDMLVAVKKLSTCNLLDPGSIQDFQREVELMQTLRHPNVVLFLGAGTIPTGEMFIVMEYLKRGALSDIIHDRRVPLDLADQLRFGLDAARGMAFLHGLSPPRIHRDLKSSNLLVSDKWVVKVADFGTARLVETPDHLYPFEDGREQHVQNLEDDNDDRLADERRPLLHEGGMLSTQVGTSLWQSPEMMVGQAYGASTDVFSFGIVLYEIFFRKAPYDEREDFRFYNILTDAVVAGYRPDLYWYPGDNDVPKDFTDLMELCWQGAPAERPAFEEIVGRLSKMSIA